MFVCALFKLLYMNKLNLNFRMLIKVKIASRKITERKLGQGTSLPFFLTRFFICFHSRRKVLTPLSLYTCSLQDPFETSVNTKKYFNQSPWASISAILNSGNGNNTPSCFMLQKPGQPSAAYESLCAHCLT